MWSRSLEMKFVIGITSAFSFLHKLVHDLNYRSTSSSKETIDSLLHCPSSPCHSFTAFKRLLRVLLACISQKAIQKCWGRGIVEGNKQSILFGDGKDWFESLSCSHVPRNNINQGTFGVVIFTTCHAKVFIHLLRCLWLNRFFTSPLVNLVILLAIFYLIQSLTTDTLPAQIS